jgi:hypothetical protein
VPAIIIVSTLTYAQAMAPESDVCVKFAESAKHPEHRKVYCQLPCFANVPLEIVFNWTLGAENGGGKLRVFVLCRVPVTVEAPGSATGFLLVSFSSAYCNWNIPIRRNFTIDGPRLTPPQPIPVPV